MEPLYFNQIRYALGVLSALYLVFFFGYFIKTTLDHTSAATKIPEARPLTSQEAEQRIKERLVDVRDRYGLSPAQAEKLSGLLAEVYQKGQNGADRRVMTRTAMLAVLTPDQRVLYEQHLANLTPGVVRPGGVAGPGGILPDNAPPGGTPPGYTITLEMEQEIESVRAKMNPDQQERLDLLVDKMKRYRYPVGPMNANHARP